MIIPEKTSTNNVKSLSPLSFNDLLDSQYYRLTNDILVAGPQKKSQRKLPLRLAIDGEWDSEKELNIGYAAIVEDLEIKTFIILNNKLLDNLLDEQTISRIQQYCLNKSWQLFWFDIDNDKIGTLAEVLTANNYQKQSGETLVYYSPKCSSLCGNAFDCQRRKKGGGGAIDLVIHVNKCDFKQAVAWLSERFGEMATIETVSQQIRVSQI